jgi:hypothetical protein
MNVAMSNRSRPHEMSLEQLFERAEGYVALAMDDAGDEPRRTFERLATLYTRLATERKATATLATSH